jgi:hypothetical protein
MQVVPYHAEYGVAVAERKRDVRPAGRCAGEKTAKVTSMSLCRPYPGPSADNLKDFAPTA